MFFHKQPKLEIKLYFQAHLSTKQDVTMKNLVFIWSCFHDFIIFNYLGVLLFLGSLLDTIIVVKYISEYVCFSRLCTCHFPIFLGPHTSLVSWPDYACTIHPTRVQNNIFLWNNNFMLSKKNSSNLPHENTLWGLIMIKNMLKNKQKNNFHEIIKIIEKCKLL